MHHVFKRAPHISPGALCAACDPMAIQPGSGLPPKGISFVHEALACQPRPFPSWKIPDYSQDFLKSMKKLIKHIDSSILLATPQGTPIFKKFGTKIDQWDHGPESIFPSTGRENLPPCFYPGLFSKICYNILQLQQVLVHEDMEAKKLMGGNGACNCPE